MKICTLLILVSGWAMLFAADSPMEREMAKLKEQRDKSIVDSTKALNLRYQTALEQLYYKALQSKDPGLAKIKAELETYGPIKSQAPGAAARPAPTLPANMVGIWNVNDVAGWKATFEFKADGTCPITPGVAKVPDKVASWSKVESRVEVVYPDGFMIAFELPPKAGKIEGTATSGAHFWAAKGR